MSDIFSEIDEDLRRDRLKSVWQRYQWLIVGVVALFIAAVGGWRGYSAWRASQADTFGDRYLAAISLAEAGKSDDAAAALAALSRTGAPGYTALAALREAGEKTSLYNGRPQASTSRALAEGNIARPWQPRKRPRPISKTSIDANLVAPRRNEVQLSAASQVKRAADADDQPLLKPYNQPDDRNHRSRRSIYSLQ